MSIDASEITTGTLDDARLSSRQQAKQDPLNGFVFATPYAQAPNGAAYKSPTSSDRTPDNTLWLQNLIDYYCDGNKGVTIMLPAGTIYVRQIVVKNGLRLIGQGHRNTIIKALKLTDGEISSYQDVDGFYGFVEMPSDGSQYYDATIADIYFQGPNDNYDLITGTNAGQMGWYFHGKLHDGDGVQGGMTNSTFRNVKIDNFSFHACWFRSQKDTVSAPMQISILENCYFTAGTESRSRAFLGTGEFVQMTFINGTFRNDTQGDDACFELSREYNYNGLIGGYSVTDNAPALINNMPVDKYSYGYSGPGNVAVVQFYGTTFYSYSHIGNTDHPELSGRGLILESARCVMLNCCQFENLTRAMEVHYGSDAVKVDDCIFLQCGDIGKNGWLVKTFDATSSVTIVDPYSENAGTTLVDVPWIGDGIVQVSNWTYSGEAQTSSKIKQLWRDKTQAVLAKFWNNGGGPALSTVGAMGINTDTPRGNFAVAGTKAGQSGIYVPNTWWGQDFVSPVLFTSVWAGDSTNPNLCYVWATNYTDTQIKYYHKLIDISSLTGIDDLYKLDLVYAIDSSGKQVYPTTAKFINPSTGPALVTQGSIGVNTLVPKGFAQFTSVANNANLNYPPSIWFGQDGLNPVVFTSRWAAGDANTYQVWATVYTTSQIQYYYNQLDITSLDGFEDLSLLKLVYSVDQSGNYTFPDGSTYSKVGTKNISDPVSYVQLADLLAFDKLVVSVASTLIFDTAAIQPSMLGKEIKVISTSGDIVTLNSVLTSHDAASTSNVSFSGIGKYIVVEIQITGGTVTAPVYNFVIIRQNF